MPMQHRLPDQVVRADPWTLFCVECSQKMKIMTATPSQDGRETRTYECACGHRESIDVAIHLRQAALRRAGSSISMIPLTSEGT
jgi:lysyl-tRNA synthetase class I